MPRIWAAAVLRFRPHLAIDLFGSLEVCGATNSTDFSTVDPVQEAYGGSIWDLFIAKISPDGARL
jgi:hypothetical protein